MEMALRREDALKVITEGLSWLATQCKMRGGIHLFDANSIAHHFYCRLLNEIYDLRLVVMDRIQPNFPAIDLGDETNKRSFQVTAEKDKAKIQSTLEAYAKHRLAERYGKLQILIIGDRQSSYNNLVNPGSMTFVWQEDVIDTPQLIKHIEGLATDKLERIVDVIRSEIKQLSPMSGPAMQTITNLLVVLEGFVREHFNAGPLYKMRFHITGADPGVCSCMLQAEGYETSAKWDQCANPVRGDIPDGFDPGLVPATRELRLFPDNPYRVPILIDDDGELLVFDGWWFSRRSPVTYYKQ
jgi:hypothetical protein